MDQVFSLSLKLLLHDLHAKHEGSPLFEKNPQFTGFELYTPSQKWSPSCLVVGMLSEILPISDIHPNIHFLCIRDRFADEEETTRKKKNILVLTTNKKLHQIFNEILSIYSRYRDWDMQMHLSVVANQGIQPLVDLTEDIIGNHMDIMDATFKLLGYTRNIVLDDPITERLIAQGYHSEETMKQFLELRRFEEFEKGNDVIVSDDYKLCKYVTIKRVFHTNQKPSMYVVMHCNHREADDSLVDLFRIFLHYMEHYAGLDHLHPSAFAASSQYLQSLLDESINNMDEAISRASLATIPFQQDYQLYAISFEDHFNTPLAKVAADINQNLLFSYVVVYNHRIVILHHRRANTDSALSVRESLSKLLAQYPCLIGISNPFQILWEMRNAYEQAGCAIEYGAHVTQTADHSDTTPVRFFHFEDCLLTLLVAKSCNSSPDLFKNSSIFLHIQTIIDYDAKHGSQLFKTLSVFLDTGKKATDTSKILHMHRNTVLYHIERIEQLLGISLNDPETIAKLYLGVKTWESGMTQII